MAGSKRKKRKQRLSQKERETTKTEHDFFAQMLMDPHVQAGASFAQVANGQFSDIELLALVDALRDATRAIKNGNLDRLEETLLGQATVLNAVFGELTQRALNALGYSADAVEVYMKLALRAQSQCRATMESLSTLRRPATGVIRQTNIANNQQVNNEFVQSKVLEEKDGKRMDVGEAQEAVRGDQKMEAVGAEHRAKDARR